MYDDAIDKVECHACGRWFTLINGLHLKGHGLDADAYKLKYKLTFNYPLCGKGLSKKRSADVTPRFLKAGTDMRRRLKGTQRLNNPKRQHGTRTESQHNKYDTCEKQLRSRYDNFKHELGHPPSTTEFLKHHNRSLLEAITRRHGTLNAYREIVGDPVLTRSENARIQRRARL